MIILIIILILAIATLIAVLLYLAFMIRPSAKGKVNESLLCDYAHRGLHDEQIPENSLAAFKLACEKGKGIELDVQLSRDGTVMVFHDYTLVRMTGVDKKLCELDLQELSELRLSDTEERIPTFTEVLSLVDGKVPILIELKGEDLNTALCEKVACELSAYEGDYCIESFNPILVKNIKKHLPHAFCGLLYTNVCKDKKKRSALNILLTVMGLNFLARPNFIAYNKEYRNSLPVKITTGLYRSPKFVWTVRGEDELSLAHSLGEYPIFEK